MFLSLFFLGLFIEIIVISCCVIAGNDPFTRFLSDLEQMDYIAKWNAAHPSRKTTTKKDRFK